jgi:hypothetical protein
MKLQHGGVGFYPYSAHSFVHLDAGSVRAWPRMTRGQLMALFPDGKTVHLPTDNKPLPGYEEARAEVLARGGAVAGYAAYAAADATGGGKSLWAMLFGGSDDEDAAYYKMPRGRADAAGRANVVAYAPSYNSDDAGTRGALAFTATAPEPARGPTRGRAATATQVASIQPEAPTTTSGIGGLFGFGSSEPPAPAPAAESEADSAAPALSLSLLPPRRPDGLIDLGALADVPLPPSRPVELPSLGPIALPAAAPPPQPTADARAQLRALFAAVATSATPAPRVKVATTRTRVHDETPGGFVAEPGAGLAAGFSKKPDADLAATRFTGPAVKALPTLR